MDKQIRYCPSCGTILSARDIERRQRLVCTDCDYVFRNNPVPIVAAIVERGPRVLLARKRDWPTGHWALISGFLEPGERVEEAVVREMREEVGLDGEIQDLVGVYSLLKSNQVFIVYRVKATGTLQKPGEELESVKEFNVAELSDVLAKLHPDSGAARALRDWLRFQARKLDA